MIGKLQNFGLPALIFTGVFAVYVASPVITSTDSRWTVPTALSILREGNLDLDEYPELLKSNQYYGIERIGGHHFSIFPAGVSILAVPFVCMADHLLAIPLLAHGIERCGGRPDVISLHEKIELVTASFLLALSAAILFLVFRSTLDIRHSIFMIFLYAFCTSAWSTASRALWQHGPSLLMLSLALYLIVKARRRPGLIQLVGLPLAISYVLRPTNILSVVVWSLFVFINYRKYFLRYVLWPLLVAAPFLFLNFSIYHSLLPPYYQAARIGIHPQFIEALAGNLVSPARGLFVYSPVFLFAVAGIFWKWRARALDAVHGSLIIILVLHWLLISSFPHWWGGYCYGPRLYTDILPYLMVLLLPVLSRLDSNHKGLLGLFVCSALLSFALQFRGATSHAVHDWNTTPESVDQQPARLWDWNDLPFLR